MAGDRRAEVTKRLTPARALQRRQRGAWLEHPDVEIRSPAGPAPQSRRHRVRPRAGVPAAREDVRGVDYRATGRLLEPDSRFVWGLNERPTGAVAAALVRATPGLTYMGVFESKYWAPDDGGREMSVW